MKLRSQSEKAYRVRLLDLLDVLKLVLNGEVVTLDTIAKRLRAKPVCLRQAERIIGDLTEIAERFGCRIVREAREIQVGQGPADSSEQHVVVVDRPNKLLRAVEDELDRVLQDVPFDDEEQDGTDP